MVFAFMTLRRCPAWKVPEILTALPVIGMQSYASPPFMLSTDYWTKPVHLNERDSNFFYRFSKNIRKALSCKGFHSKVQVAVGRFRNFFYMLFFYGPKKTYWKDIHDLHLILWKPCAIWLVRVFPWNGMSGSHYLLDRNCRFGLKNGQKKYCFRLFCRKQ